MSKHLFSIIKYFLLLVVAAGLLVLAFRGIEVKKIIHQIFQADIFWVSISGLLSIFAFLLRAYRWNLLIEPMGYSPTLKNTTSALMVGYFANLALPRLGELSRCGALSKAESIPFNKLLGTVIVERIIDVISLLICMLLAAIIEYKRLGNFFTETIFNPLVKKLEQITKSPLILVSLILIFVILLIGIIYFFKKTKSNESRLFKLIKGFGDGLKSVANLKKPGQFIFHSVLIWVLYFLGVLVALYAFPFTRGLGAGAALFLLVAGGIGMSAPVQGGIGPYHLLVSQGLILYGLTKEQGLTFATMLHSLQLILVIVIGIIALFLLAASKKKNPDNLIDLKN